MSVLRSLWHVGRVVAYWAAVALAIPIAPSESAAWAAERRGGIEIGSKGVKMTVVELADELGAPAKILTSAAVNTTIASGVVKTGNYSPAAIQETAAAAGDFARRLRDEFGVTSDKIRVVGSSGLPEASNRPELVAAISKATGVASMEFITPCREVELTIAGLVPKAQWPTAALIDIGSGNTKGGFFRSDGQGACVNVPLGSVTFADRVTKDAGGAPFEEAAARLRPTLVEAPLAEQVEANPELAARQTVFLSGGAPYAMTTLIHPEAILQERVVLTTEDIAAYLQRLRAAPRVLSPDFTAIADPKTRAAAEKEFGKVRDNFTRENLIAGAEILASLATALRLEGKTLVFDRNSITAWLRALLDPSLTPPAPPARGASQGPRPDPTDKDTQKVGLAESAGTEEPAPPPTAPASSPGGSSDRPRPSPPAPGKSLPNKGG